MVGRLHRLATLLISIHLLGTHYVQANPEWIDSYMVDPPSPVLISEDIRVALEGIWRDSCVPDLAISQVTVRQVLVVAGFSSLGGACLDVLTPWSLEEEVGSLPAGMYTISVALREGPPNRSDLPFRFGPDELVRDYQVVVPEPTGWAGWLFGSCMIVWGQRHPHRRRERRAA